MEVLGKLKCIFCCFCFLFITANAAAQLLDKNYSPLKSSGSIPEDFTLSTKKKIAQEVVEAKAKSNKENRLRENFRIMSNYEADKQLHGGNILLNEELGEYINKVLAELLKSDPELQKKIKVYVTKSPELNAYCMAKGYLFVNIGLIAKAENEAQLAFILAHEIAHYVKKHSYNTYVEFKKIDQTYKKKTFEDRTIGKLTFSKENESEADTYGFELYRRSGYSPEEALSAFDVLKTYYLPFENIPFDTTFFNDAAYRIPPKYFLSKLQPVKDNEAEDDSKSTHPNILKRKENIASLLEAYKEKQGAEAKPKFIVSEAAFLRLRDVARFEECRLYLIERSYLSSITSAYILLKKYPANAYLQKVICKSLYAMMLYKNGDLLYSEAAYRHGPIPDFTKTEGYSQQLNFMLDRIPQKEMAILTLRYFWKNHRANPQDPFYASLSDSLFKTLTKKFHSGIGEYEEKAPEPDEGLAQENYYRYAFADFLGNDPEFKQKFTAWSSGITAGPGTITLKPFVPKPKAVKEQKAAAGPGIKKIIVVEPSYMHYDDGLSTELAKYSVTDVRQENFISCIGVNARKNKIETVLIDPGDFSADKIGLYNDFSLLNDWFNERMEGGELQSCPVFNSDEVPALIQRYGTKYIMWSGVLSERFGGGLLQPATSRTFYYSLLFDLETGKIVSEKLINSQQNDNAFFINDYVDDTFDEIRKLNAEK